MELFLKRSRGSITVLVTLILVPTIFFTGFLVDLSRLKLCGNQAVMAADNYGETVLTQYDNLLKELYGLFAVTQDEEGLAAIETLEQYMQTSFHPEENAIGWRHLGEVQDSLGIQAMNGFMPYNAADVEFRYKFQEGTPAGSGPDSSLGNPAVMSTQIGDFMRFRIAQQLLKDNTDILTTIEKVSSVADDAKAIQKEIELNEAVEDLLDLSQEYYNSLKKIYEYPEYINKINQTYEECLRTFQSIEDSDSYQHYCDYVTNKDAIQDALDHRDAIEEAEAAEKEAAEEAEKNGTTPPDTGSSDSLSAEEERLIAIYDAYTGDPEAREDVINKKFQDAYEAVENASKGQKINFTIYKDEISQLLSKGREITAKGQSISGLKGELESILYENEINADLKKGIQDELQVIDKLFDQVSLYEEIANYIDTNDTERNNTFETETNEILQYLRDRKDADLEPRTCDAEQKEKLEEEQWKKFEDDEKYRTLYNTLKSTFEKGEGNTEIVKEKKSAAEDRMKEYEDAINNESFETGARNIPESFRFGRKNADSNFDLNDLIRGTGQHFTINNFANEANYLLLKTYVVQYDFGMFSSRVTNVKEDTEPAASLTGYEMSKKINYLYQAELEYILAGSDNSATNLRITRDYIMAIRGVMNFTSTYSIKEINDALKVIRDLVATANPALGIGAEFALRSMIVMAESAADWDQLKKGESVVLFKTKLSQMSALDSFADLLGLGGSSEGGDQAEGSEKAEGAEEAVSARVELKKSTVDLSKADTPELPEGDSGGTENSIEIKLDYEQYLKVMILFMTDMGSELVRRTGNLIELNINTVKQDIGENGELTELQFRLGNAYTAVNASCKVHLNFVVMPEGFAKAVVGSDTYNDIKEQEKKVYRFTVTRGY